MDVLKDKQKRNYASFSRYSPIPFYYNTEDNKYIYGLTKLLSDDTPYTLHTIKPYDTLDSLALYYYGRPDYYWIIAKFNRIVDVLKPISSYLTNIKIPSISNIYFEDSGR